MRGSFDGCCPKGTLRLLHFLASRPLAQTLRRYVKQRNNENPEDGRSDHAAEYWRAHRVARERSGTLRNNEGQ